jgi:hypothetical protein
MRLTQLLMCLNPLRLNRLRLLVLRRMHHDYGMCLFNKVDETLGPYKALEERLVLPDVLDVVLEIKDLIGTVVLEGITPTLVGDLSCIVGFVCRIVEVLEGIDQEDEEIEELLLHLQVKLLPKEILFSNRCCLYLLCFIK